MPQGKGTYGNQVGRPTKKITKKPKQETKKDYYAMAQGGN